MNERESVSGHRQIMTVRHHKSTRSTGLCVRLGMTVYRLRILAVIALVLSVMPCESQQAKDLRAAEGATRFVKSLYLRYGSSADPPNLFESNAPHAFDPSLIALARADAAAAKPDVGVLDYDPVCNCQDTDIRFPNLKVTIQTANAHRAIAIAEFSTDNTLNKIAFTLIRHGDSWRIFNIEDLSGSGSHTDLRTLLANEIQELSQKKSSL